MLQTPIPLIDSHLHLADAAFAADLPEVLDRAAAAGVRQMICNGTRQSDWPIVAELAKRHPAIVPCFGLHPWFVSTQTGDWLAELRGFLESTPSGVGEIGLDRWIEPRDEPAQEAAFIAQLELARELNRPVMIHCLRAWGWLMDVLRARPAEPPAGMLIHAYGGPVELIAPLAAMGAYFSFAGNVLEAKRVKAREALAATPLDRLLIETDSPDMAPPAPYGPHTRTMGDGRPRNEPANLRGILDAVAEIRGMKAEDLAAVMEVNARRLFGWR